MQHNRLSHRLRRTGRYLRPFIAWLVTALFGSPSEARRRLADALGPYRSQYDQSQSVECTGTNRSVYQGLLRYAEMDYDVGNFDGFWASLQAADDLRISELMNLGLDGLNRRLIGQSILGTYGHAALGLMVRLELSRRESQECPPYVLLGTTGANAAYNRLWAQFFPVLTVNPAWLHMIEASLWPMMEHASYVRFGGKVLDLHQAHNLFLDRFAGEVRVLEVPRSYVEDAVRLLESNKMDPNRWNVLLHVRDDGRPHYGRNADIGNYLAAIKLVVSLGGQVIRLGNPNMPRLTRAPYVLDLAHTPHSQESELGLLATARLFVGTNSGPINVAYSFGRPILHTNSVGFRRSVWYPNSLQLPKLLLDERGAPISFGALANDPSGFVDGFLNDFSGGLVSHPVRWRQNSTEEIASAIETCLRQLDTGSAVLSGHGWELNDKRGESIKLNPVEPNFWVKWQHLFN